MDYLQMRRAETPADRLVVDLVPSLHVVIAVFV